MKSALLVGVNKYPLLKNCDLRGCLNDVDDLSSMLQNVYGFNRIVQLKDGEATKYTIIDALKELVTSARSDDELVFAFSGHGTQIYDVSSDESDGYDECLCPSDTSMDDDATLISDDELREIFDKLPRGANLTVIMDCCHSGTNTRDIRRNIAGRYLDRGFPARRVAGVEDIESRWLTISGCRDSETSADATFNDRPNGALTYSLLWVLRDGLEFSATHAHRLVLAFLGKNGYDQHPVLSGLPELRKRPFFGGSK